MCGIAGLLNLDGPPLDAAASARVMSDAMVHRGPDDSGVWQSPDRSVALAHQRLSIVDLSPLGRNPMFWDGERLAITFNGEIYNFLELRAELEREGYRFRSHTDTEVILASYDRWGLDCVERFVGMFAFGLWDAPRRRLWLVRDRVGKKPLYYARHSGWLRFGSELKALLADGSVPRTLDAAAMRMYLRYGYVPAPHTIFQEIRKLEPAHSLVCEEGRASIRRYWDPLAFVGRHSDVTDREAEEALESLLSTAVRQRQIADVPLGAFLSGGIDSSLIVALMQEQTTKVRTFTIRFADPEFNEADHAAAVARHLGTDHTEQSCSEREMLSVVSRLPGMFDEPFGDSSAIPMYLVSAIARQHVTVALSGDGGDELFFGYPRYQHYADAAWTLRLPMPIRRLAAVAAERLPTRRLRRIADVLRSSEGDPYSAFTTWFAPPDIERIAGQPAEDAPLYRQMRARLDGVPDPDRPALLDLVTYLPDDILTKVDRASMAVSLEVRSPLVDHRVVEFALGLPLGLKRRDGTAKWLLRRMLGKRVPAALIDRPKMGFGVPLTAWLRGPLREQMDEYCRSGAFEDMGLDPRPIRELWRQFAGGHPHRPDLIWQLFVLGAWSRRTMTIRTPQ